MKSKMKHEAYREWADSLGLGSASGWIKNAKCNDVYFNAMNVEMQSLMNAVPLEELVALEPSGDSWNTQPNDWEDDGIYPGLVYRLHKDWQPPEKPEPVGWEWLKRLDHGTIIRREDMGCNLVYRQVVCCGSKPYVFIVFDRDDKLTSNVYENMECPSPDDEHIIQSISASNSKIIWSRESNDN